MRKTLIIIFAAGAVVGLALLGLWALPSPRSSAEEQCAASPTPGACRALVRGAPPPDLAARDLAAAPDLAGLRDLGEEPLDAAPARPLLAGFDALAAGYPVTAYRLCSAAAADEGLDRAPALTCAGRAALRLGWPARAAFLAQRALELEDTAAGHVLAGDALEVLRDLRGARVEYLRALDLEPDNRAALEGLRRCGGTPAPAPARDLTGDREEQEDDRPAAWARLPAAGRSTQGVRHALG